MNDSQSIASLKPSREFSVSCVARFVAPALQIHAQRATPAQRRRQRTRSRSATSSSTRPRLDTCPASPKQFPVDAPATRTPAGGRIAQRHALQPIAEVHIRTFAFGKRATRANGTSAFSVSGESNKSCTTRHCAAAAICSAAAASIQSLLYPPLTHDRDRLVRLPWRPARLSSVVDLAHEVRHDFFHAARGSGTFRRGS